MAVNYCVLSEDCNPLGFLAYYYKKLSPSTLRGQFLEKSCLQTSSPNTGIKGSANLYAADVKVSASNY